MDDLLKDLPGDLRDLIDLIGMDNTFKLVERFGGTYIKVPKCEGLLREIRNRKIRQLYDGGKCDIRELALRFRLSDRQISTILSETDKIQVHPSLFTLLDKAQ